MEIDTAEIKALIKGYRVAQTCREQRLIEIELLEETVWQDDSPEESAFATYSQEEIEKISDAVDDEHEEVRALLRRPYLAQW